jgi:hypothetical protein
MRTVAPSQQRQSNRCWNNGPREARLSAGSSSISCGTSPVRRLVPRLWARDYNELPPQRAAPSSSHEAVAAAREPKPWTTICTSPTRRYPDVAAGLGVTNGAIPALANPR